MESNERRAEPRLVILLAVVFICAAVGMLVAATAKVAEIISEAIEKLRKNRIFHIR